MLPTPAPTFDPNKITHRPFYDKIIYLNMISLIYRSVQQGVKRVLVDRGGILPHEFEYNLVFLKNGVLFHEELDNVLLLV